MAFVTESLEKANGEINHNMAENREQSNQIETLKKSIEDLG